MTKKWTSKEAFEDFLGDNEMEKEYEIGDDVYLTVSHLYCTYPNYVGLAKMRKTKDGTEMACLSLPKMVKMLKEMGKMGFENNVSFYGYGDVFEVKFEPITKDGSDGTISLRSDGAIYVPKEKKYVDVIKELLEFYEFEEGI